jgi:predicted aspartyl protease
MEKNNAFAKLLARVALLTIVCGFGATLVLASTPVRFKQVQDLIVASVTVNGAGPFDFIFDTGASSTVIDSELAKQLSLSPIESSSVLTVAGSKTVPRYRLDSLALGPKSAQNLTVLCADLREIHKISSKTRGVLGQNFLSEFDYILNYREQRIEFEENGEFANTLQGTRIPVERDRGRVVIITQPSSPQKQASKLVVDSGASSVVVFSAATKNSDLEIELDVNGGINASTIVGSQRISTGRLRKLQVGDEKFSRLPVRVVDNRTAAERSEDGLLPTSLFRSIYFNNSHNFVILNPRLTEQKHVAETH